MNQPDRVWLVIGPNGCTVSTLQHVTVIEARAEAMRFAERNPGDEFTVFESVCSISYQPFIERARR